MHLTVKVPIMDDRLTIKKRRQLEQLTRRDTTVIQQYLEIIQQEEVQHWRTNHEYKRLDTGKLDALTLTCKSFNRRKKKKNEMGGRSAPITPQQSIRGMIPVIDALTQADTGRYLDWQGNQIPW